MARLSAGGAVRIAAVEVWLHTFAFPGRTAATARWAESAGYTGLMVADSQNLNADVWIELALAAMATEQLLLGPGVTNPATRHPAVTASAAATLQEETGGRATLGFGRGDSALSQIGREPVAVADFERALAEIQSFLRGEVVHFEDFASRIGWIADTSAEKVPVAVAATGPQVIEAAARHAEMIDFTVGAEPDRLAWAVHEAQLAAAKVDRSGRVSLGAFVNVAVDDDRAAARDLVRGSTSILARFATEGAPPDGLSEVTRRGIERLGDDYEESRHGQAKATAARDLSDDFIDRFSVCGPAAEVTERLAGLRDLGLERVIVVPGSLDADPTALAAANERFAADVLPALLAA